MHRSQPSDNDNDHVDLMPSISSDIGLILYCVLHVGRSIKHYWTKMKIENGGFSCFMPELFFTTVKESLDAFFAVAFSRF